MITGKQHRFDSVTPLFQGFQVGKLSLQYQGCREIPLSYTTVGVIS